MWPEKTAAGCLGHSMGGEVASPAGLEPAALGLGIPRSIRVSYGDALEGWDTDPALPASIRTGPGAQLVDAIAPFGTRAILEDTQALDEGRGVLLAPSRAVCLDQGNM